MNSWWWKEADMAAYDDDRVCRDMEDSAPCFHLEVLRMGDLWVCTQCGNVLVQMIRGQMRLPQPCPPK